MTELTQYKLKQSLYYDRITGAFYWRNQVAAKMRPWEKAGMLNSDGYIQIRICGKRYGAHHLAWLYMHGILPTHVDHKNMVRTDNSINNLRPATQSQNNMNKGIQANSTTGFKGVHFCKRALKFVARVGANGKRKHLGVFDTPEEAHQAYIKAAGELHGQFARFN